VHPNRSSLVPQVLSLRRSRAIIRFHGNRGSRSLTTIMIPDKNHTKKPSNTKGLLKNEDRLRSLSSPMPRSLDIAADLGRTVKAVRARAHALRIRLASPIRVNARQIDPLQEIRIALTLEMAGKQFLQSNAVRPPHHGPDGLPSWGTHSKTVELMARMRTSITTVDYHRSLLVLRLQNSAPVEPTSLLKIHGMHLPH